MNFLALPTKAQMHILGKLGADDRQNFRSADIHFHQIEKKAGYRSFAQVEMIPVSSHIQFNSICLLESCVFGQIFGIYCIQGETWREKIIALRRTTAIFSPVMGITLLVHNICSQLIDIRIYR